MNHLTRKLLGVVLLTASSLPVAYSLPLGPDLHGSINRSGRVNPFLKHQKPGVLIEEFSFLIKDFKLDHQTEIHNLNISISYRYAVNLANSEYPDFRLLAKDVETFLKDYPNEDDYWEVLNKQITLLLLKKYPALVSVTSELKVDPSRLDPYVRSSRVVRERSISRSKRKRS